MYTAILLAAGRSSRMGQLKGLLDWKGKPLIIYQLEQLFSSLIDQIILVLGYQAEEYLSVIQKNSDSPMVVCNEKWEEGKSASIQKGLHAMNRDCKAILFVNLDQPITNKIVNQLIYSFETKSQKIHIPSCQGRRGHPVLFSSQLLGELIHVNEQTQGLRNIIRIHSNEIQLVETWDPIILNNFNSPLDYKGGGARMRVSEMELVSPKTVLECLSYLAYAEDKARIIAGGTDAVVQMKEGKGRPEIWVNIKGLDELRYIKEMGNEIQIGALATHTDIAKSSLLNKKAQALADASFEVGATQIRNMGTIGGNLATASPAGDTIPALYVLDAVLELQSPKGARRVDIEDFFLGPRRTVLQKDEIITKIIIKPQASNEISIFQKLGPRRAQAISIVNVAIKLTMVSSRKCTGGKIGFGSVGPTIVRAKKCEAMLGLAELTDEMINDIGKMAWKEVSPISDIRASAEYRRDMAGALLERGLYRLMKRWDNQ